MEYVNRKDTKGHRLFIIVEQEKNIKGPTLQHSWALMKESPKKT